MADGEQRSLERSAPIAGTVPAAGRRHQDGRRSGEPDSGASAVVRQHVRQRLRALQARLAPLPATILALAAWCVAFVPGAAGPEPGGAGAWAALVTVLAAAWVLAERARSAGDTAPGSNPLSLAAMVLLLLMSGAFGTGAAVATAAAPTSGATLVALMAVTAAATALPALVAGTGQFAALLVLVLGPVLVVYLAGPAPAPLLASACAAAAAALLWGQLVLLRNLRQALYGDTEQRGLRRRLEDANRALSADRQALQTESRTDPLTGLANRRYLEEVLDAEWSRCRRSGAPLSCLILDIDFFKAFNDHYGHDGGDACLRRVGGLLADTTRRAGDLVARYGGEEFVVLLPETGGDGASTVAALLKQSIAEASIEHAGSPQEGRLTISAGVASLVPDPVRLPGELLKAADLALYEAKRTGRNRVVMADPDTLEAARMSACGPIG